jgi:hypothetical protein
MPDQFEQYYKYLKSNGADVAPDFNSFKNTLSNYDNASKYYTYLKDNKFDVPETYDSFADTFGLKKKVGGAISSLTELPSEFIEPLKKGVSPNQTKEEARLVKQLGIKPMTGVTVPTNLPKQDEMRYERELKTQDAAINTLTDIYKQKGLKFDPNKPAAQKQIQDYIEQERSSDLARVTGKDGKEYLTRGQGFIEAGAKALVHSVVEPFQSAEINFTNTPSELADLLDKKIAEEPNVPESAPTKVGGYMGGLLGGLPKLMGLLAVPYFGEAAMVTEMYHNAVANERRALYERGIRSKENGGEGLDREAAAKMAMETAPITAVPDAAMGLVLARGVGGKNILPEAEKKAFKDALAPFKDVAKVAGLGGVAGSSKALLELGSGYDVTATEVLERGGKSVGEYALMDGAFKLMHKAGTIAGVGLRASKAVVSAAKNLLSSVPKEILEVQAEKYPDGKEIVQKVQEFAKVKDEVKDLVPPEKVGSVAGLTEKIKTIQADMEELSARKEKTTDALKPQIDEWLKEYQDEIDFYNNQIKKVVKSKDPSGISEEIDDVTGEKIGAKKYIVDGKEVSQGEFEAMQGKPEGTKEIVEPTEIGGLRVVKRVEDAGGEAVYEVEGERFLTADGKELKVAKVEIPKEQAKPTEVKQEAITKSKFKKPINQELLETIPEKNISDVVEKIDNGKAELNVDVFPATDLGTDNKITNNQIVYLLHSQGKEIGVLTVNNETLGNRSESSIAGVVLHPDVKGKGIGKEIYRFVNNDLINKGRKPLKSDFDITPDAINVWKSLVKSGEAREVGVAKNGKPLFEMNKPTEVKVKAEVVKPKVEKQAEPKTLSVENKEYTTKTGRQKVVLKNSDLKVIDIKTGKEASPATRRKALDEYVERYDFSKGKTAQENTKEAPEGLSSEEVDRFAIEQSENPLEVASAYIYEEPISKFSGSKDAMIAEFGVGKVTQESFKRWKDENLITGGMALTYFNKKEGLPLDVLAKSMSDHYGKEIDPQDIAEFIVKYPSGSSAALRDIESPTGRMAAERFKELTGLDLYRGMAEKIVKAEYEKRKQIEKDLIKEEYETAKQLEDAYWAAYKETDGFTKESPVSKVKPSEAAEKSVEEAYKDLTINQKRQIINSKFDELLKELKIEKICPT